MMMPRDQPNCGDYSAKNPPPPIHVTHHVTLRVSDSLNLRTIDRAATELVATLDEMVKAGASKEDLLRRVVAVVQEEEPHIRDEIAEDPKGFAKLLSKHGKTEPANDCETLSDSV